MLGSEYDASGSNLSYLVSLVVFLGTCLKTLFANTYIIHHTYMESSCKVLEQLMVHTHTFLKHTRKNLPIVEIEPQNKAFESNTLTLSQWYKKLKKLRPEFDFNNRVIQVGQCTLVKTMYLP